MSSSPPVTPLSPVPHYFPFGSSLVKYEADNTQFVNPPRLQSVPGFSHFHVFARRKTPEEIDAAEAIWGIEELKTASGLSDEVSF
jgi:hypothetical protein